MGAAMVVFVLVFLLGGWPLGEGCWEQEKIGLLQLKPFFNYHNALHNWVDVEGKESSHCCRWERVECDAISGRVIRLYLWKEYSDVAQDSENLRQPWYLNASLFLPFEELKSLDLSEHQIAGSLDNEGFEKLWGKLDKLEHLFLSDNQFNNSILSSLIEFSSLKSLDLSFNNLTKFIYTDELNKLINLEELSLWGNDIESFGSFGGILQT
ncbi:PREDICTED: receptor like protein 30 [Theobroma cacao]|uniref:Receptor like protein 30 n=1 Tax=Theobroma cacao TaxID=3641 RepID=A0AB32UQZ8_THECC|nr:PREDICTED: receptor like protein 30 [Theobroma cacao]